MNKRILVVDDEEDLRFLILTMLEMEGYEVAEAENGKVALEKLSSERFDLLLLDLMMPEMDGLSVLKELERRGTSIPVIVLTARVDDYPIPEDVQEAPRVCLLKPFENGILIETVTDLVGGSER